MLGEEKILLVEDNEYDARLVKSNLDELGFTGELVWFASGDLFIEYIEKHDYSEVMFVLLDLKMPKVSGIEVLKWCQENKVDDLNIIVFSASKQAEDIAKCRELSASAYVIKPVDFDEYTETLSTLYHFWSKFNLLRPAKKRGLSQTQEEPKSFFQSIKARF